MTGSPSGGVQNNLNVVWTLVAAVLVFLMQAGFALVEMGRGIPLGTARRCGRLVHFASHLGDDGIQGVVVQGFSDAVVDVRPHVVDGAFGGVFASALRLLETGHDGQGASHGFDDLKQMDVAGGACKGDPALWSAQGLDESGAFEENGDRRDKVGGDLLRLGNLGECARMLGI